MIDAWFRYTGPAEMLFSGRNIHCITQKQPAAFCVFHPDNAVNAVNERISRVPRLLRVLLLETLTQRIVEPIPLCEDC
uniref:Uncharacterized protein n=1 Tax=Physcomitrium patens TaxID=3218 RepID=A0A7I4BDA9_PHYPA